MFKTKIATFVSLLFLLPTVVFAQTPTYDPYVNSIWVIDAFDAVVEVQEDASLLVTETLDVTFNIDRRGIIREIPTVYKDAWGNRTRVKIELLSATRNGIDEQVKNQQPLGVKWRLGDPDVYIRGSYTYELTYRVEGAMLYMDDYDELYWNVTGTEWDAPIRRASATVVLPSGAEVVQEECYTGVYGSTEQACQVRFGDGMVRYDARDTLTVAVGFTKGVVYEPTWLQRAGRFMLWNQGLFWPWVLVLWVLVMWWRKGRDPLVNKPIITQFEPPRGLKVPYAGTVLANRTKRMHVVAMIIQLAVDGYIQIKAEKKDTRGRRLKNAKITLIKKKEADDLDPAYQQMMHILFRKTRTEIQLSKLKGKVTSGDLNKLHKAIADHMYEQGWFVKSAAKWQIGFIITGITIAFFFPLPIADMYGWLAVPSYLLAGAIIIIVGIFMMRVTADGAELKWEMKGFERFMKTAEQYRSKWQEEQVMFTQYLPYAIAFDHVQEWQRAFAGLEQVEADWWIGDVAITQAISSDLFSSVTSSLSSAAATPASTGGSGGGGMSGGGFGGGGGSSW